MLHEDEEDELLAQLPDEDLVDVAVLGEYDPIKEYDYMVTETGQPPISLCRKKYPDRDEAQRRMHTLCLLRNKRPVHNMFRTARHWVLPVVDAQRNDKEH